MEGAATAEMARATEDTADSTACQPLLALMRGSLTVIPVGAKTGEVIVVNHGFASNGFQLAILNPLIESVSLVDPRHEPFCIRGICLGNSVKFSGSGFGDEQGTSHVLFNGVSEQTVKSWFTSEIVAVVPCLRAGTGSGLTVSVDGVSSAPALIEIGMPRAMGIMPSSGPVGTIARVVVEEFSWDPFVISTARVIFGGVESTDVTLTPGSTSITAEVPAGTGPGLFLRPRKRGRRSGRRP